MSDETAARPPLFTPLFFTMCGFTCTVFLSAFLLLPTAPLRILALGGSSVAAGAFLGLLTYASAFTAPLTGALADRMGRRRTLIVCSLVLSAFAALYGVIGVPRLMLVLVAVHGVFWSGLLSGSAAYITGVIPESRRAEGIGYWGLSTMVGILVAPTAGLWLYEHGGWPWLCALAGGLNALMAAIAWRLPEQPRAATSERFFTRRLLEWRVLLASLTLFLYSFGYGAITSFSALYARGTISDTQALNLTFDSESTPVPKAFWGGYAQGAWRALAWNESNLTPFVRYEQFNTGAAYAEQPLGVSTPALPTEKVWTAGINYYLNPNVVFKFDYQDFNRDDAELGYGNRFNLGIGYQF